MYKVGQFFKDSCNDLYLLAQVDMHKVAFICLSSGNRWDNSFKVYNAYNITNEEFKQICGTYCFEQVEVTINSIL